YQYLLNFIGQGPATYGPFCAERLRRTYANGVRAEPPTWLELQVGSKKHIPLQVILATGESLTVSVDSASTSQEMCVHIAHKQGLSDHLGFSLQVAVYDKFWSLGSGRDHVMDAIAQCEQLAQERGESQRQSPCTELIYRQVLHGVWSGEYSFEKEEELVELLARHCYVQLGASAESQAIQELLWASLVTAACAKAPYTQRQATPLAVQEQVVDAARLQWPLLFSRLFEVITLSGPRLPKTQLILAVNWKGLCFLDQREKTLLELSFPEVMGLVAKREAQGRQRLLLSTMHEEYEFASPSSVAVAELVALFLEGLKERSVFAMALQDRKATDDATLLAFKKGDLLVLTKKQGLLASENWTLSQNDRTGKTGLVPMACLYTIPTVTKPSAQLLVTGTLPCPQEPQGGRAPRCQPRDASQAAPGRRAYRLSMAWAAPWARVGPAAHLPGPILCQPALRQPLPLKRGSSTRPTLPSADIACQIFGRRYPSAAWPSLELTDQIFMAGPAILKQLTTTPTGLHSEERGWQLLWLCTGLFPPSKGLLPHAQKFIDTRRGKLLAPDCSRHIQRVLRTGPRKQPPHQVEVEAAEQNISRICHKVYFPNDTSEMLEVVANTRVRDVCDSIATRLQLASWEGCSLFIKIADKVISQKEGDFFFDSLRQVSDWVKKNKPQKEGAPVTLSYQVYFMRKLWLNITPGKDVNADTILHYHQELPKYLRGFHKCSREDAIHLAGLIYKAQFNNDRSQLASVPKILRELVPKDLTRLMSSEEWKKSILLAYDKHKDKTVEEAKVAFLKWICRWPTFGSAFFEVKQTSEPSYPDIILIAINRHGVLLIHPKTKGLLTTYPFTKISSWSSGSTYFHMVLGSLGRGSRLLCETSLGYKMDDLLTSYVQQLLSAMNKQWGSKAPALAST
uniref:Myosin VIIB n=1 Tax=Rhinopithecus bieti TaxID=61621 RepID=A0A2K6MZJ8_RHIBE